MVSGASDRYNTPVMRCVEAILRQNLPGREINICVKKYYKSVSSMEGKSVKALKNESVKFTLVL